LGPIIGVDLGIHPATLPFLGIVCGLVAVVRGAQPLPEGEGPPSPGAEADAKILRFRSSSLSLVQSPGRSSGLPAASIRADLGIDRRG
jgi:hypothetical protein